MINENDSKRDIAKIFNFMLKINYFWNNYEESFI